MEIPMYMLRENPTPPRFLSRALRTAAMPVRPTETPNSWLTRIHRAAPFVGIGTSAAVILLGLPTWLMVLGS